MILNNFTTRLGHSVARMLAALLPHDPQFKGRQVVTFHNQRDFIFFRRHRYIFEDEKKARLQELGPRFTLKLQWVQKGTFDTKFGEYEWHHKVFFFSFFFFFVSLLFFSLFFFFFLLFFFLYSSPFLVTSVLISLLKNF